MTRIEVLIQERDTMVADRQREYNFVQSWRAEKEQYGVFFKSMRRAMVGNGPSPVTSL